MLPNTTNVNIPKLFVEQLGHCDSMSKCKPLFHYNSMSKHLEVSKCFQDANQIYDVKKQ